MSKNSLLLSIAFFFTTSAVFADLPVGPVYLEDFPKFQIALEPPALDSQALSAIAADDLESLEWLADLSDGIYARATEASDLERLFDDGMERFEATPVASFEVRRLTADGQPHRAGVRWCAAGRVPDGHVRLVLPSPPAPKAPPEALPEPSPSNGFPVLALLGGGAALLALPIFLRGRRSAATEEMPSAASAWAANPREDQDRSSCKQAATIPRGPRHSSAQASEKDRLRETGTRRIVAVRMTVELGLLGRVEGPFEVR